MALEWISDMASGDWIRLYRDARDHEVFQDDWLWRLWSWCLLSANFRPGSWKNGQTVLPGQFITGRASGAESLRVSPSKFYRGLQRLVEMGCITTEANSNWTTVTICNWSSYQASASPQRTASEQPADNQRTTNEQPADTIEEEQEFKNLDKHTQAKADRLTGMVIRSEGFNRFMKVYPRPTSPEAAWEAWQAKVYTEVMRHGKPDAEIEEMIVSAAEEFRDSPAGQPPSNGDDYRLSAHKWILGNCWEESRALWQQPNGKRPQRRNEPTKPKIQPLAKKQPAISPAGMEITDAILDMMQ